MAFKVIATQSPIMIESILTIPAEEPKKYGLEIIPPPVMKNAHLQIYSPQLEYRFRCFWSVFKLLPNVLIFQSDKSHPIEIEILIKIAASAPFNLNNSRAHLVALPDDAEPTRIYPVIYDSPTEYRSPIDDPNADIVEVDTEKNKCTRVKFGPRKNENVDYFIITKKTITQ